MFRKFFLFVFLFTYVYAVIRYQCGKNLWGFYDYFFSLNKALAWTAGSMFALSILSNHILQKIKIQRKELGVLGYSLAIFHIILSILLLNSEYYPSFYTLNMINSHGWISIFLGIISICLFTTALLASLSIINRSFLKCGKWGVLINFLHVLNIGYLKWFPVNEWSLNMPPITLLFSMELVIIFLFRHLTIIRKHE